MAFHVACPLTCRRVCDCELGFPAALRDGAARVRFLEEIAALEEFLRDPWTVRSAAAPAESASADSAAAETVQVLVPRVVPQPAPAVVVVEEGGGGGGGWDEVKRPLMQRQAFAASLAAEDYARRLEVGGAADATGEAVCNLARDDQALSSGKVICRICFSGENEGTEKAGKMLSCTTCNKKYHRSCLRSWAENRDLFHWSSWSCPSCRICEVCRRTGDPSKLMYCKRCDGAYHCYCQQPPHKNVGHGPYLCPKHTRCHSCGSTVPGSGLSTRWFLGYTCCDACGRLFVKGNYCPVCLKVYRDSETTPMVCCDICEKWVHCVCDGISDEKYQQFQADQNLQYKCAACRGDSYQVKDMDDAVRELWKRRNLIDHDLIVSLRAAAGLPTEDDIFSISPYSDDEQSGPVILKNDNSKPLKFCVKGIGDRPSKNSKEYAKHALSKKAKKKEFKIKLVGNSEEAYQNFETQHDARSFEDNNKDQNTDDMNLCRTDGLEKIQTSTIKSLNSNGLKFAMNPLAVSDQSIVKEIAGNNFGILPKVKIKSGKLHVMPSKASTGVSAEKNDSVRGTKLVIHLGSKNLNLSGSPRSETSSCHRDQDVAASLGTEDNSQQKTKDNENIVVDHSGVIVKPGCEKDKIDNTNQIKSPKHGLREKNIVKLGKVSEKHQKVNGNFIHKGEKSATYSSPLLVGKRDYEIGPTTETTSSQREMFVPKKQSLDTSVKLKSDSHETSVKFSSKSSNDPKPLLKLKFKNPYFEQRSSWAPQGEEENSVKGQRSKRKRPSTDRVDGLEEVSLAQMDQESLMEEAIDANWILKKLGKGAIGKRVEVQLSDNSWKLGMVVDINLGTSSLSVRLDDGISQALELGKQAIRLVPQKQKRTKL